MLRGFRRLATYRSVEGEDRVIKFVRDCLRLTPPYKCLKESLMHSEISGNPGKALISLGVLFLVNPSVAENSLARVMVDEEIRNRAGGTLRSVIRMALLITGSYKLYNALIRSGRYPSKELFKELLSSASCVDLVRIGEAINADNRIPVDIAVSFIREVMDRRGCLSGKEAGLRIIVSLLRKRKISLSQLREVLGSKSLKILIARRDGKVNNVLLYLGDELIAKGADKDYVADLISLSSQLSQNSVEVSG